MSDVQCNNIAPVAVYDNVAYEKVLTRYPEFRGTNRFCNICGFRFAKFANFGITPREARCPLCGSLERHRHLAIHLLPLFPFLGDRRVLHFAPEAVIKNFLLSSSAEYYDVDIDEKKARYRCDITNIAFEDNMFDHIVCIHVLEHIVDDIKALSELFRVLKPGGTAFLAVPCGKSLYEDYSIVSPEDRAKAFGQSDHVRRYSCTVFEERIKQVGFTCVVSRPSAFPPALAAAKLGDNIYIASKQRWRQTT